MGSGLELSAQSLNTRRPAAPTLPSFELPPPPFTNNNINNNNNHNNPLHQHQQHQNQTSSSKWSIANTHPLPPASHPHLPANVSVGNLLTPPASNQSGETAVSSHPLGPGPGPVSGISSDLSSSYWGTTPTGTGSGSASAASVQNPTTPWASAYTLRNSYSPSGMVGRSATATVIPQVSSTDGLSQPFEAPSLTFPQALPAPPSSMALYHPSSGHATSPAPLPSNDPYATQKGPPPMYGAPPPHMPSPHQTGFSPMYGPPAISPAGLGIHPQARMSAQSPGGQPPLAFPRQPWPSYSLPAMNGPVMTNVHSPNSPMSMMGGGMQPGLLPGFNSGHVASTQHLYGAHPPPHGMAAPAADRPFKCDQCPQSFNRNHDLKRHKRIHLAVKPFPCSHCDKSFSRKDALKVFPLFSSFLPLSNSPETNTCSFSVSAPHLSQRMWQRWRFRFDQSHNRTQGSAQ